MSEVKIPIPKDPVGKTGVAISGGTFGFLVYIFVHVNGQFDEQFEESVKMRTKVEALSSKIDRLEGSINSAGDERKALRQDIDKVEAQMGILQGWQRTVEVCLKHRNKCPF